LFGVGHIFTASASAVCTGFPVVTLCGFVPPSINSSSPDSVILFALGVGHSVGDLCGNGESSDAAEQVKNSDWLLLLIHFPSPFPASAVRAECSISRLASQ
jgi:hypothetical protein